MPLILAAVMGGAMFGDNLSVISDTTIAATKTQGVEMRDKFRINLYIALPAAILTIILLFLFARPDVVPEAVTHDYNLIKVFPYISCTCNGISWCKCFCCFNIRSFTFRNNWTYIWRFYFIRLW